MPSYPLMTWVPAQKRWTKMYRGVRHYVSTRQLGCPGTKEGSIVEANRWWRDKQAELDYSHAASQRKPEPMEDLAAAHLGADPSLFGDVKRLLFDALIREEEKRSSAPAPNGPTEDIPLVGQVEDADTIKRREVMALLERLLFGDGKLPSDVAERLPPARASQLERGAAEIRGESPAAPDRTVAAAVERWFSMQRGGALAGNTAVGSIRFLSVCVKTFAAFVGEASDVSVIDAEQLDAFYSFCLSKIGAGEWSVTYARTLFGKARAFVRWIAERGLIPMPPNISSRSFRFGSGLKPIETWTIQEVQTVLASAPERLRLCLLLMMNTGATGKDVSDLRDHEVDWQRGRIVRARSKTRGRHGVPTVDYLLWPSTFELLKKHRSGSEHVLLTKSGRPYIREELKNGRPVKSDTFRSCWKSFAATIGFKKSPKLLRKTAASLLESHETYGRCTTLYLGHAPASVKDRHYAAPPQALLDAAIRWLGEQLGV